MLRVDLEPEKAPALLLGGDKGRTGTGEGVEHHPVLRTENRDQRRERCNRLLRRVQLVARIAKLDHVRDWPYRRSHIPLGEQISHFMLGTKKASGRGVAFTKHDMPYGPKPGIAPRRHEKMHAVPAVEADAERGGFQHAIDLGEGRTQPVGVAVIRYLAPVATLIIDKIRRVG